MPIGSRSYYDAVGSTDKKNGSKPGIFRKGEAPAAPRQQTQAQSRAAAPVQSSKTGPAKKRRGTGAHNPRPYVPPMSPTQAMPTPVAAAVPVDGLVAQIVDLAGRVSSVLAQAESAVKRAEQLLSSAADAAARSEAAALRAELAASRAQLGMVGDFTDPSAGLSMVDSNMYSQSTEPATSLQDMLRSSILQLDNISDRDTQLGEGETIVDRPQHLTAAGDAPYGVRSDGPHAELAGAKGGQSVGPMHARDRVVARPSRQLERTDRGNREAVASGLVTFHQDSEIPRVSPFILGLTPESAGQQSIDDAQATADSDSPRKIGVAV